MTIIRVVNKIYKRGGDRPFSRHKLIFSERTRVNRIFRPTDIHFTTVLDANDTHLNTYLDGLLKYD